MEDPVCRLRRLLDAQVYIFLSEYECLQSTCMRSSWWRQRRKEIRFTKYDEWKLKSEIVYQPLPVDQGGPKILVSYRTYKTDEKQAGP